MLIIMGNRPGGGTLNQGRASPPGNIMITRRRMLAATGGIALSTAGSARAETPFRQAERRNNAMEIKRNGSQPSGKGPADYFTGAVRIDPLFEAPDPARARGASVTFEPGARTAWHTHPLGQTLIVTAGFGRVQRWGSPIEEIRPGDVVWFPPGEKHWHGASPTTALTHIAVQEALDGKVVDWLEKVSDQQYRG
jgi:quercetin dioxygenase-like cupin family protein